MASVCICKEGAKTRTELVTCQTPTPLSKAYPFSYQPLDLSSGKASQKSQPGYGDIHPCSLTDFKSLQTLSLKSLKVTGDVLECFIRNCPFLERLVLRQCSSLVNFEVCGPSLALKFLEICQCFTLKSITIRDTNLVSLKITEVDSVVLQNVPMLVEVSLSGWFRNSIRNVISGISCCLAKLEFLSLYASKLAISEVNSTY